MSEFTQVEIKKAARVTTTTSQTGIDISKYIGTIKLPYSVTAVSGTTPTLAAKIQESDTVGGTYTDVTGGGYTGLTDADGFETLHLETRKLKSFIRLTETLGGSSPVYDSGLVLVGRKQVGG
jgi:hypothetical protein